jgi:hypothetical protein
MKITWFGQRALRIYLAGEIIVLDAHTAEGVDRQELAAGARLIGSADDTQPSLDPQIWRPRRLRRALDAGAGAGQVLIHRVPPGALLFEGDGEAPLAVVWSADQAFGRWADGAVVVLIGEAATGAGAALALLAEARARLLAWAGGEPPIGAIGPALAGTGFMLLDPGLALEA